MMNRLFSLVLVAVVVGIARPAAAGGYGMAGCGLGSVLMGSSNGAVTQILASTTNNWGGQAFSITSGTSNCGGGGGGGEVVRIYIEANRELLAKEMARGSGESLKGLSSLAGCSNAGSVGTVLQKDFGRIFPKSDVSNDDVTAEVIRSLKGAPLACTNLG